MEERHLSEETRKKMSEAKKGKPSWNKGKHLSEEHRKKLSEAHKGKHLSEEHKKKLGEASKGRLLSEEARKKISEAKKGKPNTKAGEALKGRHLSEATRRKKSEVLKGSKNPAWKGGVTPENRRIRESIELRLWRETVFARDNWTCQRCGKRGGKLHAHHILNFADYPELRTSIENGITLCKECHNEFHKKYGNKHNTREQLEEFLTQEVKCDLQSREH